MATYSDAEQRRQDRGSGAILDATRRKMTDWEFLAAHFLLEGCEQPASLRIMLLGQRLEWLFQQAVTGEQDAATLRVQVAEWRKG